MAVRSVQRRKRKFDPPKLMLTSMMDMFTIILIFLLCSFSDEPDRMKDMKSLALPESSSTLNLEDSIKIVLSTEALTFNDELIATVAGGKIDGLDPERLDKSSLFKRLKAVVPEENEADGGPEVKDASPRHIFFLCDRKHSFKTINCIMKTAGLAGYPNFQFAVLEGKTE